MRAEGQLPDWPKQCFIPTSVLTLMLQEEGGHDLMALFVDALIIVNPLEQLELTP